MIAISCFTFKSIKFILTDQSIKNTFGWFHPLKDLKMPRIGAEPERRKAIINAAIEMIGEQGSLEVSVKEIAKQAGMSSALAFHYFGGKDEIILQTMRHLMRAFSHSVIEKLEYANTSLDRIDGIIQASFSDDQFDRKTIAAWLVFYLKAYSSQDAARLLNIYKKRLHSNLVHSLVEAVGREKAGQLAEGLGALIDGLYIRHGLSHEGIQQQRAIELCRSYISQSIKQHTVLSGDH